MNRGALKALLFLSAATVSVSGASASVFVGSWQVDQGPSWTTVPTAYSGQEAAALLFGGLPTDYAISTIGTDPNQINNMAWVSTWGGACGGALPCGTQVSESFVQSTGGLYSSVGDTSAYVLDWATGSQYTNYAFRIAGAPVPEPGTWAMMLIGFGAIGWSIRRTRRARPVLAQAA